MISKNPAVGRMVHYREEVEAGENTGYVDRAAVITEVVSADVVHLFVMSPDDEYSIYDVKLGDEPDNWHWPVMV